MVERGDPEPASAPALVTGGLTPDIASPTDDEPAGEPIAPKRRGFLRRLGTEPMWVLGLVVLVDEADKNIVRGLVTPLQDEFGVGDLGIAVLLSMALLFNGLVTIPAGYLADRWNRTRAIGGTVIGWSAISAAGALSLGFPMLVAMRSALGFGQAITEPSAASLIGDHYQTEVRGKAFSIQQMMLFVGAGMGIALGGAIGNTLGWRPALVIVALPGLGVAWLVYRMREPKRGSADMLSALGVGAADPLEADEDQPLFEHGFRRFFGDMVAGLREDVRTIMSIRTMKYALVGVAAILFTITAVAAWLPQYYERQLGLQPGFGEVWVGVIALAGVPGVLLGGRAADRWAGRIEGGRLGLPAIFLFIGLTILTIGYLVRPSASGGARAEIAAAAQVEAEAEAELGDLRAAAAGTAVIEDAERRVDDAREETDDAGKAPFGYSSSAFAAVVTFQFVGFGFVTMSIPGLRAGLTDAVPAHLRGTGFGAFNLVAVVLGQAAAPFVVGALSAGFDSNLRTAFLIISPISFAGAAVLWRSRKYLEADMQKIMMAVLEAIQHEKERREEEAADQEI